ncbi:MAG: hypothetical protein OEY49_13620, partial [Candidatus Heimdallarchaeota archaeon]|nr:hypothetical protein [Candidatus Heimdallarchaeota archaeon]
MIDRLRRYKRCVSPVVTMLFLFVVLLVGISISLTIIYPQTQELNDQMELSTAGTSLLNLDNAIKEMIINGVDSQTIKGIYTGSFGTFALDQTSQMQFVMYNGIIPINLTQYNPTYHNRLQIFQTINQEVVAPNSHSYLVGGSNQDYLFLNSSTRSLAPWTILNQTRPTNSLDVITSLSYRILIDSQSYISDSNLNVTVSLQLVNFIPVNGKTAANSADPDIIIDYKGIVTNSSNWFSFTDDFTLQSALTLSDPSSTPS